MLVEFDVARVEEIRKRLVDAPEIQATTVSRAQALRMLAPEIAQMQSRGYSLAKIAGFLSGEGLAVSVTVLKTSLQKVRSAAREERGRLEPRPRRARPKVADAPDVVLSMDQTRGGRKKKAGARAGDGEAARSGGESEQGASAERAANSLLEAPSVSSEVGVMKVAAEHGRDVSVSRRESGGIRVVSGAAGVAGNAQGAGSGSKGAPAEPPKVSALDASKAHEKSVPSWSFPVREDSKDL